MADDHVIQERALYSLMYTPMDILIIVMDAGFSITIDTG